MRIGIYAVSLEKCRIIAANANSLDLNHDKITLILFEDEMKKRQFSKDNKQQFTMTTDFNSIIGKIDILYILDDHSSNEVSMKNIEKTIELCKNFDIPYYYGQLRNFPLKTINPSDKIVIYILNNGNNLDYINIETQYNSLLLEYGIKTVTINPPSEVNKILNFYDYPSFLYDEISDFDKAEKIYTYLKELENKMQHDVIIINIPFLTQDIYYGNNLNKLFLSVLPPDYVILCLDCNSYNLNYLTNINIMSQLLFKSTVDDFFMSHYGIKWLDSNQKTIYYDADEYVAIKAVAETSLSQKIFQIKKKEIEISFKHFREKLDKKALPYVLVK